MHASLKEVQFIKAQLFSAGNLELCSVSSVKLTYFWTKNVQSTKKGICRSQSSYVTALHCKFAQC